MQRLGFSCARLVNSHLESTPLLPHSMPCRWCLLSVLVLTISSSLTPAAAQPAACAKQTISSESGGKYVLKANSSTVAWGYFCEYEQMLLCLNWQYASCCVICHCAMCCAVLCLSVVCYGLGPLAVLPVESLKPALVVRSGAEVTVEMITHHAGDDPDKMIKVRVGASACDCLQHPLQRGRLAGCRQQCHLPLSA